MSNFFPLLASTYSIYIFFFFFWTGQSIWGTYGIKYVIPIIFIPLQALRWSIRSTSRGSASSRDLTNSTGKSPTSLPCTCSGKNKFEMVSYFVFQFSCSLLVNSSDKILHCFISNLLGTCSVHVSIILFCSDCGSCCWASWLRRGCGCSRPSSLFSTSDKSMRWVFSRVADPHSFHPDPDPASGSRALMTKNWKKITAEKKLIFLPIPRPPQRTSKLQKKPLDLKIGHLTLQNMNFQNFFLLLWVIFALLDPDPDSESGSTDSIESGFNPDPDTDPQPWCFPTAQKTADQDVLKKKNSKVWTIYFHTVIMESFKNLYNVKC